MKLVVADDDRQILDGIVTGIGWKALGIDQVFPVPDGLEALGLLRRERPDILVSSVRMPGLGGPELAEELKKVNPWAKCILYGGYSDLAGLQAEIRSGALEYTLKPVQLRDLSCLIEKARDAVLHGQSAEDDFQSHRQTRAARFLQDVCSGAVRDGNRISEGLEEHFAFQAAGRLLAVLFQTEPAEAGGPEGQTAAELLEARLRAALPELADGLCWSPDSRSLLLLVNAANSMFYQKYMAVRLRGVLEQIIPAVREELPVFVRAGVSLPGAVRDISELCRQAFRALDGHSGESGVFCFRPDTSFSRRPGPG